MPYLALLTQARGWMLERPHVLQAALAALRQANDPLPDDVQSAVTSMRAGRWVYLRDTAHYSIFLPVTLHEDAQAYAVKSLTTRLRDMTGCSGLVLQTALMEYAGGIVTDGLLGTVAYLGPRLPRKLWRISGASQGARPVLSNTASCGNARTKPPPGPQALALGRREGFCSPSSDDSQTGQGHQGR